MAIVRTTTPLAALPTNPEPKPPTAHQRLVDIAVRWTQIPHSKGGHGCQVAIPEAWPAWAGERPDVIAWRHAETRSGSVLVEAKTSHADFAADRAKPWRQAPEQGIGRWRYFMCDYGVIQASELPERWGLLWVDNRGRVTVVAGACAVFAQPGIATFQEREARLNAWFDRFAFPRYALDVENAILTRSYARIGNSDDVRKEMRRLQNNASEAWRQVQQLRGQLDSASTRYAKLLAASPAAGDDHA